MRRQNSNQPGYHVVHALIAKSCKFNFLAFFSYLSEYLFIDWFIAQAYLKTALLKGKQYPKPASCFMLKTYRMVNYVLQHNDKIVKRKPPPPLYIT